jgi:hypothetical protein
MMTGRLRQKIRNGDARVWWGSLHPVLDPDVDEDWFGAHPGNLLQNFFDHREKLTRHGVFEWAKYQRCKKIRWSKRSNEVRALKAEKQKPKYQYDWHVVERHTRNLRAVLEHRDFSSKQEEKRKAEYLIYHLNNPDRNMTYDQWCIRGLLT